MDWMTLYTQLSEQLRAGASLSFWQDCFVSFCKAFLVEDRWKLYLKGVLATLELTVIALAIGVVLGVLVAVVRTAHDQQRAGRRSPHLGGADVHCPV